MSHNVQLEALVTLSETRLTSQVGRVR